MSFASNIPIKNIANPYGLAYKNMSQTMLDILDKGALVHMFEFKTPTDITAYSAAHVDKFKNLANAFLGIKSGCYSEYRGEVFFNKKENFLEILPCSAIRTGYPMELFNEASNVGVLLDPTKVKFILMQPHDCFSNIVNQWEFTAETINIFNDKTLYDANHNSSEPDIYVFPNTRTDKESNALHGLFQDHFWKLFSEGKKPGEAAFKDAIQNSITKFYSYRMLSLSSAKPLMTEILANVPPEALLGVVIHSDEKVIKKINYNSCQPELSGIINMSGIMLANLFREIIAQKTQTELPILHYHSNLKMHPIKTTIENSFDFRAPGINEINVENKKVARVLEENPAIKRFYEHYLGVKQVQDIILGKAGPETEKKF